jgi:signal peptidase
MLVVNAVYDLLIAAAALVWGRAQLAGWRDGQVGEAYSFRAGAATVCRGARVIVRVAFYGVLGGAFIVLIGIGIGPWTGRYRTVTVLTGSMGTTAPAGSMVVTTPQRLDQVRVGQIITFQAPVDGHPVETHRVFEVLAAGEHPVIRTKGDGNANPDPWIVQLDSGPLWRTRAIFPGLGKVVHHMRSPMLHHLTVFAAPALFALLAMARIWYPDAKRELGTDLRALAVPI